MKKISVIVTRERKPDWVSRMIMWRLGRPYSHIAIKYTVHGQDWIFQSDDRGNTIEKLEALLAGGREIVGEKEVNLTCSGEEFLGFVKGADGNDYSHKAYIGFIFPYKWIMKFVGDGKASGVCSELVARTLFTCCSFEFSEDMDFLDPREVWEAI